MLRCFVLRQRCIVEAPLEGVSFRFSRGGLKLHAGICSRAKFQSIPNQDTFDRDIFVLMQWRGYKLRRC
jgi:hypothetical protein